MTGAVIHLSWDAILPVLPECAVPAWIKGVSNFFLHSSTQLCVRGGPGADAWRDVVEALHGFGCLVHGNWRERSRKLDAERRAERVIERRFMSWLRLGRLWSRRCWRTGAGVAARKSRKARSRTGDRALADEGKRERNRPRVAAPPAPPGGSSLTRAQPFAVGAAGMLLRSTDVGCAIARSRCGAPWRGPSDHRREPRAWAGRGVYCFQVPYLRMYSSQFMSFRI
jgi:hypothetical protein